MTPSHTHNNKQDPQKMYNSTKEMLLDRIRNRGYWPEQIRHPSEFRKFFIAKDLTYCGFALNLAEVKLEKKDKGKDRLSD